MNTQITCETNIYLEQSHDRLYKLQNHSRQSLQMTTKRKLKLLLSLTAEAACYRKLMKKSCGKYSQAKLNYMQGFFNFQILPSSLTVAKSTITIF